MPVLFARVRCFSTAAANLLRHIRDLVSSGVGPRKREGFEEPPKKRFVVPWKEMLGRGKKLPQRYRIHYARALTGAADHTEMATGSVPHCLLAVFSERSTP